MEHLQLEGKIVASFNVAFVSPTPLDALLHSTMNKLREIVQGPNLQKNRNYVVYCIVSDLGENYDEVIDCAAQLVIEEDNQIAMCA